MSVPVIKAITKQIRLRLGSTDAAATAAGVSAGVWSHYENADKGDTTIPLHRLHQMSLTSAERRAIVALFVEEADLAVTDLLDEAGEATEAAASVQSMVRLAAKDGVITETEARRIRAAALNARAQMDDVLMGVGA